MKMRVHGASRSTLLGLLALVLLCAPPLRALSWSDVAPVPIPKGNHGAGVIADRIYVAGGGFISGTAAGSVRNAYEYRPPADRWYELAPMQQVRTWPSYAVADLEVSPGVFEPRLYILGGADVTPFALGDDIIPHPTIEEYDPVTNTWRTMASQVPAEILLSSRAVVVDNLVYLIGGHSQWFSLSASVYIFDPNSDTMTPFAGADLPDARTEGAAVLVGRAIYYFGGYLGSLGGYGYPTSTALRFDLDDPVAGWQEIDQLLRPNATMAAVAVGTTIYLAGGWNGFDQGYNQVDAYDTVADSWALDSALGCREDIGVPIYLGRAGLTLHAAYDSASLENRLYAVGGSTGISEELSCHEATPVQGSTTDTTPPTFDPGAVVAGEDPCPDPPTVHLTWDPGADVDSPPVTYNVYRDRLVDFVPDPANRIAAGLADTFYDDTDVVCWAADPRPYFYIVRAQDSAAPPNEDDNEIRHYAEVRCDAPPAPENVGNRLLVGKDAAQRPVLDWSTYPAPAEPGYYRVYRKAEDGRDIYATGLYAEPDVPTLPDDFAGGVHLLLYKVRAVLDCLDTESSD